jgi:hypothetical protein
LREIEDAITLPSPPHFCTLQMHRETGHCNLP